MVGKGEIACYAQFLYSHHVFKCCMLLMRQNEYLLCRGLRLAIHHTMPNFYVKQESFENTVVVGEKLVTSIFSISHHVFYPISDKSDNLTYI